MPDQPVSVALSLAVSLQKSAADVVRPSSEIAPSRSEPVVYMALVRGTRGYIERVAHQVNGAYANGWYDASAVMLRRLIETLIIECFEAYKIESKIKDSSGNYYFLKDLVDLALSEPSWTLGRNVRSALPKLKEVGDKSAHSRRYNAHREDIDKLLKEVRDTVQELLVLARLK
ncbi:MAG: DUF4145 domain-containing protein [Methyloversatilis sp.]|uniref:DUF4145 domain-containing protein n=1 Tax=Methyloversatilis sp. TaxID=2569862 RepID=UPI0025CFBA00|nr:DUF4145 domain-containing protein [Methyloversatilis sp.]MCR6666357.1 DUF4145 domain-containing protein [Methyloversatilis sp.]